MRSDYSPDAAFTLPVRVRSYEAGRNRRIGLGTTLRLLEYLATEASSALGFTPEWYVAHGSAWLVREMRIVLGELPTIGDELLLGTWLSEWRKVQAYREYAIWRPGSATLVARARARWAYVDRTRGVPLRVPDEMVERFSPLGPPLRRRPPPIAPIAGDDALAGAIHTVRVTARETEADVNQHINNTVYADWLGEGLYRTLKERSIGFADRELRHRDLQIEYLRPTVPGDRVRVETVLPPLPDTTDLVHHQRQGGPSRYTAHRAGASAPLAAGRPVRTLDVTQRILGEASGEIVARATSRHLLLPLSP